MLNLWVIEARVSASRRRIGRWTTRTSAGAAGGGACTIAGPGSVEPAATAAGAVVARPVPAAFFSRSLSAAALPVSVSSSSSAVSDLEDRGWLSLQPSRYRALAFSPSSHDRRYDAAISSTLAEFGRLIVLEIAPEMNGWPAAIMRMWPCGWMNRLP